MGDKTDDVAPATIDHQEVHVDLTKHREHHVDIQTPGVAYSTNGIAVTSQPGGVPIVAAKPDPSLKPKDFVMTNCFVVFACNFIFGFIGYHFGVKSNWAWRLGQIDEAKKKAKIALIFAIIGICVGILTYCLAFGLYFGLRNKHPIEVPNKMN